MNLSELTEKLYAEGVEKGNAEAQQIVEKAQSQAAALLEQARREADAIVAEAQTKADALSKNAKAELKLYAAQSVSALRTEVTNLLTDRLVQQNVQAATADAKFMQGLILKLSEQMLKQGDVVIDARDAEALRTYFTANAKGLLDKGVSINEVKGQKTDFQIRPAEGGYKLAFGEQEFVAYFKEFLRPQLVELLF